MAGFNKCIPSKYRHLFHNSQSPTKSNAISTSNILWDIPHKIIFNTHQYTLVCLTLLKNFTDDNTVTHELL